MRFFQPFKFIVLLVNLEFQILLFYISFVLCPVHFIDQILIFVDTLNQIFTAPAFNSNFTTIFSIIKYCFYLFSEIFIRVLIRTRNSDTLNESILIFNINKSGLDLLNVTTNIFHVRLDFRTCQNIAFVYSFSEFISCEIVLER